MLFRSSESEKVKDIFILPHRKFSTKKLLELNKFINWRGRCLRGTGESELHAAAYMRYACQHQGHYKRYATPAREPQAPGKSLSAGGALKTIVHFATSLIAAKPVKPCDGGVFGALNLLLKKESN